MNGRHLLLPAVLVGLTLAPASGADTLTGVWTLFNAAFAPTPNLGGDGVALRIQTDTAGFGLLGAATAAVRLPERTQVDDIAALSLHAYYETGGCGGGSPRYQVEVDKDGDGDRDANVHVYAGPPPNFGACPVGVWTTENLLDGVARWDSSQLGGPFFGSQATAHGLAGPDHQVLNVRLVWDSTWLFGPSVIWVDELAVNCFVLDDPTGLALSKWHGHVGCGVEPGDVPPIANPWA